jgi:serine/threonine-protein kinase
MTLAKEWGVMIALMAFVCSCGCNRSPDVYDQADAAYHAGRYEEALRLYSEVIAADPANISAYLNRGNCYSELGQLDVALQDYELAIQQAQAIGASENDPAMAYILYNRGYVYYKAKEYRKSLDDFEHIASINPDYPDAQNHLAWILATCPLEHLRDSNRAIQFAQKESARLKWKNAGTLDTLAAAFAAGRQFDRAVEWEQKAIELATDAEDKAEYEERLTLYRQQTPYVDQ